MEAVTRLPAVHRLPRRSLIRHTAARPITTAARHTGRRSPKQPPAGVLGRAPELFQLPAVVLDLDSENSPYVRDYDKLDEREQHARWAEVPALYAAKSRIRDFQQEMANANQLVQETASDPFGPWKVSDIDILSVALQGVSRVALQSPEDPVRDRSAMMEKVLQRNAIPHRTVEEGESKVIAFMLHRQQLGDQLNPLENAELEEAAFLRPEASQQFETLVSACQSLEELRRLVSGAAQTRPGCRLISRSGPEISRTCSRFLEGTERSKHGDILVFLNNLTSNLQSKNIDVGEVLGLLGLRVSSIVLQPQAIHRYLEIVLQRDGFETPSAVQEPLSAILESLSAGSMSNDQALQTTIRPELFSLLTGRSVTGSVIQSSFRTTIGDTKNFVEPYSSYIALLGELGALRMLWHEWQILSTSPDSSYSLASGLQGSTREELFVDAITRSARLIQRSPDLLLHESFHSATGGYAEDALLDLQCIGQQVSLIRSRSDSQSSGADDSASGMTDHDIAQPVFRAEARSALDRLSITDAMTALQRLLSSPR